MPVVNAGRFAFHNDPEKLKAFKKWLQQQLRDKITKANEEALWRKYVEEGFKKGAGRAFDDARPAVRELASRRDKEAMAAYAGTRQEFLRSSFGQPEAVHKVQLLASRSFDDLEDITSTMSNRMVRTLADGLVQGQHPNEIARTMADEVDMGLDRAQRIARTEIIRAHAEGQLTTMEMLGVEEVGAMVEWSTAGDDHVCPRCEALEGVVLTLDEARGMIPLHPNCRCAWVPANVGEDKGGQTRGKGAIDDAMEAADAEPGESVARERPRSILNAFSAALAKGGGL